MEYINNESVSAMDSARENAKNLRNKIRNNNLKMRLISGLMIISFPILLPFMVVRSAIRTFVG